MVQDELPEEVEADRLHRRVEPRGGNLEIRLIQDLSFKKKRFVIPNRYLVYSKLNDGKELHMMKLG